MEKKYIERLFDKILAFSLKSKGAVVVEGPKWCGKSTTCKRFANEIVDLMPLKTREEYILEAKISPDYFLKSRKKPLLIDEWQHIYFIWDQIKVEVDESSSFGQYILTGSVTDKDIDDKDYDRSHTGNGRIIRKKMRTMSLYESGESNGTVSLTKLKNNDFQITRSNIKLEDYAFLICRGGWPLSINDDKEVALAQAKDYYEVLVSDDLFSLKSIKLNKDEAKARKVLRSYARNISIAATTQTLIDDCVNDSSSFDKETFYKYLTALEYLHVIEELPAWNPNIRSKTAIRTKDTRHFVDPSIAVAALGLSPEALFKNMDTFGLLFESLVVRDIRTYCDVINAKVYKYRDSKKREADLVIVFEDGSWALIEVKLGGKDDVDQAANKLKAIAEDIDIVKTGNCAFLMVVTKDSLAYRRDDGVYVVPLGCLKD
ncbi:MAG: ATP-binding protein [Bacilli bacterium]|nr:ATP-binding protein [Bacilli bacterium]